MPDSIAANLSFGKRSNTPDEQRAKILGLNAVRMFNFDPDLLLKYRSAAAAN